MQPTVPRREYVVGVRSLRVGQRLALTRMLASWMELGYDVTSVVEEPGTFSRRGGILDIFPADALYPVRIELFGDEVDSLRVFDPATQRSLHRIERCVIPPASEALPKFGDLAVEKLSAVGRLDPARSGRGRVPLGPGVAHRRRAFQGHRVLHPLPLFPTGNALRLSACRWAASRGRHGSSWPTPSQSWKSRRSSCANRWRPAASCCAAMPGPM